MSKGHKKRRDEVERRVNMPQGHWDFLHRKAIEYTERCVNEEVLTVDFILQALVTTMMEEEASGGK